MMKTCLNSRDGLIVLEMDKLAYIQADGNYANLVYMCGDSVLVTLGLSKLEEVIRGHGHPIRFRRLYEWGEA